MTERVSIRFAVKEHEGGEPWIAFEGAEAFHGLARSVLGLELAHGTSVEDAERFAEELQRKVSSLAPTR
jgi:hypothetical protein